MKIDMDSDLVNNLQRTGLNKYESKAYLALLGSGPLTASDLSKKAEIPRPRSYDILNNLEDKGMVSTQPGRPTKYNAHPIEESIENLKKTKKKEHEEEMNKLEEIKDKLKDSTTEVDTEKEESPEDFVWFLKDREKIDSKIKTLLQGAEREVVIASDPDEAREHVDRYSEFLREARDKGVSVNVITPEAKGMDKVKEFANVVENDHKHRFMAIDDHSILFLTPREEEKEVGALVKSPFLTSGLKKTMNKVEEF